MKTDEDLLWIDRTLAGETAAFGHLVEKYQDSVYTIVRRILLREDESADAAQLVFIKAFQSLAGFNRKSGFNTWISRIAYNHAVSEYRKKKAHPQVFDEKLLEQNIQKQDEQETASEKEKMLQQLESEVEQLEETDRALISLYYTSQNSVETISTITGLSVSNVKIRLFRIRNKLKEKLLLQSIP
jgi:RNA polymerase sigma-70 factor (ECF subfamily)